MSHRTARPRRSSNTARAFLQVGFASMSLIGCDEGQGASTTSPAPPCALAETRSFVRADFMLVPVSPVIDLDGPALYTEGNFEGYLDFEASAGPLGNPVELSAAFDGRAPKYSGLTTRDGVHVYFFDSTTDRDRVACFVAGQDAAGGVTIGLARQGGGEFDTTTP